MFTKKKFEIFKIQKLEKKKIQNKKNKTPKNKNPKIKNLSGIKPSDNGSKLYCTSKIFKKSRDF